MGDVALLLLLVKRCACTVSGILVTIPSDAGQNLLAIFPFVVRGTGYGMWGVRLSWGVDPYQCL